MMKTSIASQNVAKHDTPNASTTAAATGSHTTAPVPIHHAQAPPQSRPQAEAEGTGTRPHALHTALIHRPKPSHPTTSDIIHGSPASGYPYLGVWLPNGSARTFFHGDTQDWHLRRTRQSTTTAQYARFRAPTVDEPSSDILDCGATGESTWCASKPSGILVTERPTAHPPTVRSRYPLQSRSLLSSLFPHANWTVHDTDVPDGPSSPTPSVTGSSTGYSRFNRVGDARRLAAAS
jgi:hypothetical protein